MSKDDQQKLKNYIEKAIKKQKSKNIFVKYSIKKNEEFFLFGAIPIDKHKLHYPKNPTRIDDVDHKFESNFIIW